MLVLSLFAFLAGAGTAVSPCVLPVLPALLAAGATGGRRRPLGIAAGLTVTFTITIVGIARVVDGVGLGANALRDLAIVALLGFGATLLVPAFAARIEAPLSRLGALGPRSGGRGLVSGLGVGAALGFLYAPCAGPILAAVITVSAASGRTVLIGLAYALGSGSVLLALSLGGRRMSERVRRAGRGPTLQRGVGVVMVITALAMLGMLDVRFQTALASHLPAFLVDPTHSLERSHTVQDQLARLQGRGRFAAPASRPSPSERASAGQGSGLPRLGTAPDFTDTQRWFNTTGDAPLTMASLRGRVVLVDFWTYTCINCLRTLPYLKAWDARYRGTGLTIVGVHSPEFSFEHDAGNVAAAIRQNGLRYPVVQDNNLGTWNAYGNQFWPAEYLIDAQGEVRSAHFGEGDYGRTEAEIRALLAERGLHHLGRDAHPVDVVTPSALTTPETYLGAGRAMGFEGGPPAPGTHRFGGPSPHLALNQFAYGGTWRITPESATAQGGATIDAHVRARNVYLVLGPSADRHGGVRVLLDGHPVSSADAGPDVHGGALTVTRQRLYTLVSLPRVADRRLTLRLDPGVSGYAFTFG